MHKPVFVSLVLAAISIARLDAAEMPPNIVLFFVDNLGNGDLGCFGSKPWFPNGFAAKSP